MVQHNNRGLIGCHAIGYFLSLILVWLTAYPLYGLNPEKRISQYLIDSYTTADGLPQNSIQAIKQTDDGYIWMGTYEGLVRYNGIDFEVFNRRNVLSITNNGINTLCKDSKNRLWIGTPDGLICHENRKFTRYTKRDGLAGNFILRIFEDRKQNIWIGTTDGLSLKQGKGFKNLTKKDGLAHNYIFRIVDDRDGNIIVSTGKIGFDLIKKDRIIHFSTENGLGSNYVRSLYRLNSGEILIGMRGGGLSVLRNERIEAFETGPILDRKDIMDIYQDRHGSIWIGTEKNGLYCYRNGKLSNRSLITDGQNSHIRTIFEDREGSLWVGTKMGLFRIMDGKYSEYNIENQLPFNIVRSVFEDSRGTLWIGAEGKGIYSVPANRISSDQVKLKSGDNIVLSITEDRKGSIWFGTFGNGLFKVKNGSVETYTIRNGLSNNSVRVVFADSRNNLWVGTNGGGVNVISDNGIIQYNSRNGLSDDFIYAINEDIYGNIWIGTYSGGLNRIKDRQIQQFNREAGLKDIIFWAIYPDRQGNVWFGTNGGGLFRYQNGEFLNYSSLDGLYSDLAFQILEAPMADDRNENRRSYLWMNCNNGVFAIDKAALERHIPGTKEKLKCIVFGTLDKRRGIVGSGPAQPAGWKGRDGKLYFVGKNGLSVFNTERIYKNRIPPAIVIDKLEVDRVIVDGISYNNRQNITIPAGKKRFEFFYTGLSYINARKIRYKYKIEGIDTDWVDAGTERRAVYMNLSPGQYEFKLMAYNSDGVRSDKIDTLQFVLKPFFWQTLWFEIGSILFFLLFLFTYVRFRLKRLRKVMERETVQQLNMQRIEMEKSNLEKEISLKRDFNAMLIHDLKSPLTALIGYADMVKNYDGKKNNKVDYGKVGTVMKRSIDTILKLVNSMLELSKFESGKLNLVKKRVSLGYVIDNVIEITEAILNKKEIRIEKFYNQDNVAYFDPDKIGQVIQNLLNNSIKFSPEGSIIRIELTDAANKPGFVECAIIDEGSGVPKNKRQYLFKMYSQVGSSEDNKKGTGLGLCISNIIIEAHHGEIGFRENPAGKGSIFYFTLPKN